MFILFFNNSKAATGNASDGELLALTALLFILVIIAFGYFIDFMKQKIISFRNNQKLKKNTTDRKTELFDEIINRIPEFN